MKILDGKSLSLQISKSLTKKISTLNPAPTLAVILIGNDPSSLKYVDIKTKKALELGIPIRFHHLPQNTDQSTIGKLFTSLNTDQNLTGYFVQLPLPPQLDRQKLLSLISTQKDVDGLNPNSGITPAVVVGIIKLLKNYQIKFTNKNIVIINDSQLIGQPLKNIFESQNAFVTLANDKTKDLKTLTQNADILISATGVKNLVTSNMIKQDAVVVDVASGDVDFTSVATKTSFITPTFGGVGPMTVVSLFENLLSLVK